MTKKVEKKATKKAPAKASKKAPAKVSRKKIAPKKASAKKVVAPKISELTDKNIYNQGIICNLKLGAWAARAKVDPKLLAEDAPEDIVKVAQDLLLKADKKMLKDATYAGHKAYRYLETCSMPFPLPGCFFIRKTRVVEVHEQLLHFEEKQKELLEILLKRYEDAKKNFEKEHKKYYRPEKYPDVDAIRNAFYIKWSFRQFTPDAELKTVSPELYQMEMKKFKEEVQEMKTITVTTIGQILIDRVDRLSTQCAEDKINARTINNIVKFVDNFETEWDGFIAHKELKAIFKDVKKHVVKNGSDVLKDNEAVRKEVGKKMEKLVKTLELLPNVKLKRNIEF